MGPVSVLSCLQVRLEAVKHHHQNISSVFFSLRSHTLKPTTSESAPLASEVRREPGTRLGEAGAWANEKF